MNIPLVKHLRAIAIETLDITSKTIAIREALIFEYILENIPIFHDSSNLLVGDFGFHDETPDEVKEFFRNNQAGNQSVVDVRSEAEKQLLQDFFCKGNYTSAHTCICYEKVINRGVKGMLEDIAASKQSAAGEELEYLTAMEIALTAFLQFAERFVLQDKDAANNLKHVPLNPARSFPEALQSIWLVHLVIGISEYNSASISLGRLDQYAYDCFLKSDEQEAELWLNNLWQRLNAYGDAACNVNLGGIDKDGNDLCNKLSYLIARTVRKNLLPSPILSARIHPGFPQNLFDLLTDPELFKVGQPTFYGEHACLKALRKRNIQESDIHKWTANSCMGLIIQGYEISDMWGCVVSTLLPLELALNNGAPFNKELTLKLRTAPCSQYDDFQSLYQKFREYWYEIIDFCIKANQQSSARYAAEFANPYISAFLDDCIARGQDRVAGGVRYYNVITEAFALANAADALFTIKKLVFEQRKYTLAELVNAVKNNYAGHDELLGQILTLPKYGDGDSDADAMIAELARDFAAKISTYSNDKIAYAPSFHTLNAHVGAGKLYGASLDGRMQGTPFAKNIGTSLGKTRKDLTSLLISATSIDQSEFFGGQPLDISLDTALINSTEGKRKFQQLLQTYFKLGGLQLQVNGLTAETLQKALKEPDRYDDLIVRIGGYSNYFNRLSNDVRNEMVKRFSNGT
jgi:trans-4-hydroxy-L-proline dehydratase